MMIPYFKWTGLVNKESSRINIIKIERKLITSNESTVGIIKFGC